MTAQEARAVTNKVLNENPKIRSDLQKEWDNVFKDKEIEEKINEINNAIQKSSENGNNITLAWVTVKNVQTVKETRIFSNHVIKRILEENGYECYIGHSYKNDNNDFIVAMYISW